MARLRSLPDRVVVGRVRRAHGVRGEVVVEVMSDTSHRFTRGGELTLVLEDGREMLLIVSLARPHKGGLIVGFQGVDERIDAEALKGGSLEISRQQVPRAPEGASYYFELMGCLVRDVEAGEIGEVVDVQEDGGGILLQVQGRKGKLLLPFVSAMVTRVDVEMGEIEVKLPPGLVEICGSA